MGKDIFFEGGVFSGTYSNIHVVIKSTCTKPSLGESLGMRLYIKPTCSICLNYETKLDYIWEWLRHFLANHRLGVAETCVCAVTGLELPELSTKK